MTKLARITGAIARIGHGACTPFARKDYRLVALSRQPSGVETAGLATHLEPRRAFFTRRARLSSSIK